MEHEKIMRSALIQIRDSVSTFLTSPDLEQHLSLVAPNLAASTAKRARSDLIDPETRGLNSGVYDAWRKEREALEMERDKLASDLRYLLVRLENRDQELRDVRSEAALEKAALQRQLLEQPTAQPDPGLRAEVDSLRRKLAFESECAQRLDQVEQYVV